MEAGQLGVFSFGNKIRYLHSLDTPFTSESGARITSQFTFDQTETNFVLSLKTIKEICIEAREKAHGQSKNAIQLVFMISDGKIDGGTRSEVRNLLRDMEQQNILVVLLICDTKEAGNSILDTKMVSYKDRKMVIKSYMDDYPFSYYLILRDISILPECLSDALTQWFQLLSNSRGVF